MPSLDQYNNFQAKKVLEDDGFFFFFFKTGEQCEHTEEKGYVLKARLRVALIKCTQEGRLEPCAWLTTTLRDLGGNLQT